MLTSLAKATSILLTLTVAACLAATPEQEVRDTEKAWGAAIVAADVPALEKLMADTAIYGHASGAEDNKKTYIDKIRTGAQKYVAFNYDDTVRVQMFGNMALVYASATSTSLTGGKENSIHMRFLHVYRKSKGQWQLLAHQSAKLP